MISVAINILLAGAAAYPAMILAMGHRWDGAALVGIYVIGNAAAGLFAVNDK